MISQNSLTHSKPGRVGEFTRRVALTAPGRLLLALVAILGLVIVPLLTRANESYGIEHKQKANGTLTGNWMVTVTPIPAGPVFLSLLTYFADGNLLQETSNPVIRSTGRGTWEKTGRDQFTQSIIFFRFDAARTYLGTRVVTSTITLSEDGRQYVADSVGQNFDPLGNLLTTSGASEVGHRL